MPNQDTLNQLFEYRDGMIFWRKRPAFNIPAGSRAGSFSNDGYRKLKINNIGYVEHRIIWIMFNGEMPEGYQIDHKDCNPSNNKIENLRLATQTQNRYNQARYKKNKSGYKGVGWHKAHGVWRARMGINKKVIHLGSFKTPELAHQAYKDAAIKIQGEFANFG